MARNFHVNVREDSKQSSALQLFGDFDATSACELIDVLGEQVKKNSRVAIDTNGLKTIEPFGLDVFLPRMSGLHSRAHIEVTGRFSEVFRDE
jgi:ABC-type transporter Mla MlaB component